MLRQATEGVSAIAPSAMPPKLNWAVMWVIIHGGEPRIIEKWFDDDLVSATELYMKLKANPKAGGRKRQLITLRCANYAFPPPERLRVREERVKTDRYVIVKRKGKKYKKYKTKRVVVDPMRDLNAQGILWCPYCRELRRFQQQDGFFVEDVFVPQQAWYCPVCAISAHHRIIHKYNPMAYKYDIVRRTRVSGKRSKGKRARRK